MTDRRPEIFPEDSALDFIDPRKWEHVTEWDERYRLTKKGQVTIADPSKKTLCYHCVYFNRRDGTGYKLKDGMGTCRRMTEFNRKLAYQFEGHRALACSQFDDTQAP